jgi:hypothetical protein
MTCIFTLPFLAIAFVGFVVVRGGVRGEGASDPIEFIDPIDLDS